jgi:hypothetical protein
MPPRSSVRGAEDMRKRDILIDLTPLLDVVLIMMFLVLLQNKALVADYKDRYDESAEQLIVVEQELNEANERLDALSDWDNERLILTGELGLLSDWKTSVEEAVYFVEINILTDVEPRGVSVKAKPDTNSEFPLLWAEDDSNRITNGNDILDWLDKTLSDVIEPEFDEKPVIILFDYSGIFNKEFNLIDGGISSFLESESRDYGLNIYYSAYERDS